MISRREFLQLGAAAGLGLSGLLSANASAEISFRIVADIHYADKDRRINRYYRDSIEKLEQCVAAFNQNFTLKALVDGPALKNNSYAVVTIGMNNRLSLRGFGREQDRIFS